MSRSSILQYSLGLLVLFPWLSANSLQAQDCLDYSAFPHILSAVETESGSNHIIVEGTLAFVGSGDFLQIFDVAEPDHPVKVGSQFIWPLTDFAVSGNYVFVASQVIFDENNEDLFFRVYDVSDPANPQAVSCLHSWDPAYSIAAAGEYVYLSRHGMDGYFINVVDVSNPGAPQILSSMPFGDMGRGMTAVSGFLYVASGNDGLQIIDVSDPLAPAIIGQYDCIASSVEVVGNLAFVAVGPDGVEIIDVSDPANPAFVSRTDTPGICLNVSVSGDRIHAADSSEGVTVIDFANPHYPWVVYSCVLGQVDDVWASGNQIFATAIRSLQVLSVPNFDSPARVGFLGGLEESGAMDIEGALICLARDTGTVFTNDYHLVAIDVSAPAYPDISGTLDLGETTISEIMMEGGIAYLASRTDGLIAIDLSDPSLLHILGQIDPPGGVSSVAVTGTVAYVGNGIGDLYSIDISDPSTPQVLGSVSLGTGDLRGIAESGGTAYVADLATGVRVVDISDPLNPQAVGTIPLSGNTTKIRIAGGNLFVGNSDHGLLIYDLADPMAPALLGNLPTGEEIRNLRVANGFVYLANARTGLQIIDISNPASPRPAGLYNAIESGNSIALGNDNIFLVSKTELQVLTLPCPAISPVLPLPAMPGPLAVHPNPFNPATTISYDLGQPGHVSLEIFDLTGKRIKILESGWMESGHHQIIWLGRDTDGRRMASGVYFCRLETAHQRQTERMTLIK